MKSLLSLSYGTGSHEQEVIFSVLSALHISPEALVYNTGVVGPGVAR